MNVQILDEMLSGSTGTVRNTPPAEADKEKHMLSRLLIWIIKQEIKYLKSKYNRADSKYRVAAAGREKTISSLSSKEEILRSLKE